MPHDNTAPFSIPLTVIATVLVCAQLAWAATHGGVPAHHFLQRADLPAISNWWGLLILPVVTWLLAGRIARRVMAPAGGATTRWPRAILLGFAAALLLGAALSIGFETRNPMLTEAMFFLACGLAVLLPVYRAECVLGFVFGMSTTFGVVLPLLAATVIAGLSAFLHRLVYAGAARMWAWTKRR